MYQSLFLFHTDRILISWISISVVHRNSSEVSNPENKQKTEPKNCDFSVGLFGYILLVYRTDLCMLKHERISLCKQAENLHKKFSQRMAFFWV